MVQKYDIFVCYDEVTGKDFAEALHAALTGRRGYKVFVAHLERDTLIGDFRAEDIDPIIENCNIFIFINTLDAIIRPEIIREIKQAFPDGNRDKHELWIFRENKSDVKRGSDTFTNETRIELERINQPKFSNVSEISRLALRNCDNKRQLPPPAINPPIITPSELIRMKVTTKFSGIQNVQQLVQDLSELIKNKDYDRALSTIELIQIHEPFNLAIANYKGIILSLLGRNEKSIEQFAIAITMDPKNPFLWANQALALTRAKKFKDAMNAINKALTLRSDQINFMGMKAHILFVMNDFAGSLEWYDKVIFKDKNNSFAWSSKGAIFNRLGDNEEARKCLDKAIKINRKNVQAWYNLGAINYQEEKYEESLNSYNEALKINPHEVLSLNNRGIIFGMQGKHDDAIKDFDECIRLDPKFSFPYNNKGLALTHVGKLEDAIASFQKAIELDDKYVDAHLNQAITYMRLEKLQEALKSVNNALKLNEKHIDSLKIAGAIYSGLKDFVNAEKFFKEVVELQPNSVQNVISLFQIHYDQKQYDKALAICDEHFAKFPDSIPLLIDRSSTLIKLRKYEDSLKDCDKILSLDPTTSAAYYNKACAFSLLKRKKDALSLLGKAITLDKNQKANAKVDEDFIDIKDDPMFLKLLE